MRRPACYEERAELKKAEARLALLRWRIGATPALDPRGVRHEMSEYQGRISQMKDVVEIDTPPGDGDSRAPPRRLQEYQSITLAAIGINSAWLSPASPSRDELMPEPATREPQNPLPSPVAAPTLYGPAEEAS